MAEVALIVAVVAALLNLAFNTIMTARGFGHPWSSFLMMPSDRFADFFKMSMSFPGGPLHPIDPRWAMDPHLNAFAEEIVRAKGTIANHFHLPPLAALIGIELRAAMQVVDPLWLFVGLFGAGLAALYVTVGRLSPRGPEATAWAALALCSYPTLMLLDRGHLFGLVSASCLIAAMVDPVAKGRVRPLVLIAMAVVLNLRPNAGIFALTFFLCGQRWTFRDMIALGAMTAAIFGLSMLAAHAQYPAYDLNSFRDGLDDYQTLYMRHAQGMNYGSSLFGAMRTWSEFNALILSLPLLLAGLIWAGGVIAYWRRLLRDFELLFLTCAAYALGGQVFGDYHLIVFVAPLLLLARDGGPRDVSGSIVFAACLFVLIPKNYIFLPQTGTAWGLGPPWSLQVVANPLAILAASLALSALAFRKAETAPSGRRGAEQTADCMSRDSR